MYVVFVVVGAAVVFAVIAVALGRGTLLDDDPPVVPAPELDDAPLRESEVASIRFTVVARGYRMDQVDDVLTRLGRELTERDQRIAQLEAALGGPTQPPEIMNGR